ncbi:MAG: ATP-binding protein [Pseudomonadota bacterium]
MNISKKVFLLFASFALLTVILAVTVFFGLEGLRRTGGKMRLMQDFKLQITELSSFKISRETQFKSPERARFQEEFSRAVALLEKMNSLEANSGPLVKKQINAVREHLGFYQRAFDELFVKYEQDIVLHGKQEEFGRKFYGIINALPPEQGFALYKKLHSLPVSFEDSYHHSGADNIGALKTFRQTVAGVAADSEIVAVYDGLVANSEAIYFNFLGIRDREDFLTDTANHFFDFASTSVAGLVRENGKKQEQLRQTIFAVCLAAIILTLVLWWKVTRYFQAFIQRQKYAIASIEEADYDYDVGSGIPDDELGDQARFMKELSATLKKNMEQLKSSENEVRIAKEEWERTFDAIGDIVTLQDADMRITRANKATFDIIGSSDKEVIGKKCHELFHGVEQTCDGCPIPDSLEEFKPYSGEIIHEKLGKTFLVSASPVVGPSGELQRIVHFAKDITELKKLEMQFLQAQKMEAIGRLSSGVAHDFNNILSSILGYSELSLLRKADDPGWRDDVEVIRQSGEKAAALVRQLMAFSRIKQLDIRNVNISETVTSLYKMLSRMIGEDVTLDLQLATEVSIIKADPGQIEQIVMNLAVNARDAMPTGGRLSIRTGNVMVDKQYARMHVNMASGPYVMLALSDNGHGMDNETKSRIFEPFFTTKQAGKGTGLGLATVYSIVKQHKGFIDVYSEPGKGTTFKLYFPATGETVAQLEREQDGEGPRYGNETILVVDDEAIIRQIVVDSLSPLGYTLLGAASGEEALSVAESYPGTIDLLLTDIIMPGMDGNRLAGKIREKRPDIRLLFMSGYLDVKDERNGLLDTEKNFLPKPVMPSTLMRKLREVLR